MDQLTRTRLAREEVRLRERSALRAREVFDPRPHTYEGCPRPPEEGEVDDTAGEAIPFETWVWAVEHGVVLPGM